MFVCVGYREEHNKEYNGYPSWNQWNVSLWINNDEGLYRLAYGLVKQYGAGRAARELFRVLDNEKTPDGGVYNLTAIRGALVGMVS